MELEEEWCFDDEDPEGILLVLWLVSFSVSEPELSSSSNKSLSFAKGASSCCGVGGLWPCRGVVCPSDCSIDSGGMSVTVIDRFAMDSVTPDASSELMCPRNV